MKRLIAVQQSLRVNKTNEGDGGRFRYRTAEQIIEAVKPLLKDQNLAITLSDEVVAVGNRVFVKATATLWGIDGTCNETTAFAELDQHLTKSGGKSMSNEQCTGSASSYARKYALCGMFAIDNGEDEPDALSTLDSQIANAKSADDLNALMAAVKEANDPATNREFNAQAANLGLVFDKEKHLFVKQ